MDKKSIRSEYEYALEVYECIARGDVDLAISISEQTPYSDTVYCQLFLGWQYYQRRHFDTSMNWFLKAVEKDSAEAIFGIASICYAQEKYVEALYNFKQAAENGYGRACHWVGNIYRYGMGVNVDNQMALYWYKRGADLGFLFSKRCLIYLKCRDGNVFVKLKMFPKYVYLILMAIYIGNKDIDDERLVDIENAFDPQRKTRKIS